MKALLLACTLLLMSLSGEAQDFAPDSTIVIQNSKQYATNSTENLSVKGQIDAERNTKSTAERQQVL